MATRVFRVTCVQSHYGHQCFMSFTVIGVLRVTRCPVFQLYVFWLTSVLGVMFLRVSCVLGGSMSCVTRLHVCLGPFGFTFSRVTRIFILTASSVSFQSFMDAAACKEVSLLVGSGSILFKEFRMYPL